MSKQGQFYISEMYCTICGKKGICVPRHGGKVREAGHLKKMYCLYCGHETNHCEVRPFGSYTYDDFKEEYTLGRFTKEGDRIPIAELTKCSNYDCKYNKGGNCWNGNGSYQCKYKQH